MFTFECLLAEGQKRLLMRNNKHCQAMLVEEASPAALVLSHCPQLAMVVLVTLPFLNLIAAICKNESLLEILNVC